MALAQSSNVSPDIESCTVCMEDYTAEGPQKPRILAACLHTFCEDCLEKLGVGEESNYRILCPICRELNILLNRDGIQSLPINTRAPCFSNIEAAVGEYNVLAFIDPDVPSCPVCGGITLFYPCGQEADIIQCHTCKWVSEDMPQIPEWNGLTNQTPIQENSNRTLHQMITQGTQTQNTAPLSGRSKCVSRRMINYLRKRLSFR
ncbi:tripartite motif-containing protein 2-like [Pelobates fuscus]|uniref:tripartite motif-containing protein 2-like n=1 Tax=Pelobates fuscus TaxID=191477 RepID=UPI002FE4E8BA